jgi:hypothetical protein
MVVTVRELGRRAVFFDAKCTATSVVPELGGTISTGGNPVAPKDKSVATDEATVHGIHRSSIDNAIDVEFRIHHITLKK